MAARLITIRVTIATAIIKVGDVAIIALFVVKHNQSVLRIVDVQQRIIRLQNVQL